jgi:hypothetical protein
VQYTKANAKELRSRFESRKDILVFREELVADSRGNDWIGRVSEMGGNVGKWVVG